VARSSAQLSECLHFSPEDDFDLFLKRVPARWAVYLLADANDQPVQLLCVRNLRNSLKRRLGGDETVGPSRRVNYRDLVRRIHWRLVDSAFESDWIYYEAARDLFPDTYKGMVGFRPAWFVHVDPNAQFPRYAKTIDLSARAGLFLGPLEDKHAAANLIQSIEDAFDLCRYHNILIESPHAKACAYKEMGKCPAPCDGSLSLEQYRRMVEWSAHVVIDPTDFARRHQQRMEQAAGELRFELAAKIKTYVDQISRWGKGAFRHVRTLNDFRFVALQRGPREGTAKVFLITPGDIEEIAGLIAEPPRAGELLAEILRRLDGKSSLGQHAVDMIDTMAAERIGIVTHHLFLAKQTRGVFLHAASLDEKSLLQGCRELRKQKATETADDEGLVKELQALP
jgi:excinuclease UvrABC nuclease subunit